MGDGSRREYVGSYNFGENKDDYHRVIGSTSSSATMPVAAGGIPTSLRDRRSRPSDFPRGGAGGRMRALDIVRTVNRQKENKRESSVY